MQSGFQSEVPTIDAVRQSLSTACRANSLAALAGLNDATTDGVFVGSRVLRTRWVERYFPEFGSRFLLRVRKLRLWLVIMEFAPRTENGLQASWTVR